MGSIAPFGGGGNAVPSNKHRATPDPRAEAFSEWLASLDRRDWKAGLLATRKLRGMGLSVCLTNPSGDRRGA
jgi:hypothetical protein